MGGKLGATPRFGKAAEPSIAKVNGLNFVARVKRSATRDGATRMDRFPDCAALHPGYRENVSSGSKKARADRPGLRLEGSAGSGQAAGL
jgi:hypothetical protein